MSTDDHVEMVDKTGTMRAAADFSHAREVVGKRFIGGLKGLAMSDPELFMELTTILDALKIAEVIAAHREKPKP